MKYQIDKKDNLVVFSLHNTTLDSLISAKFKAEILAIAKEDIEGIIIDLSNVAYIDSSGIGAMLFTHRQSKENNFPVVIVGIQNTVFKMFRISHMDNFFQYEDSVESALEKLS